MRYLALAADYMKPTLRDVDADIDEPWRLLSTGLTGQVRTWNQEYHKFVATDLKARVAAAELISELDQRGLELAARIEEELRPAKVRDFNEGLMRYLT
ncbi:Uncharacterised protein [Mycobacteroides abscessus subsp. abscessus]|nr:Uncharacterised protein [Mycobacteroides abscessus subsp. abscessus]